MSDRRPLVRVLTPGLTPRQAARLQEHLSRLTRLPAETAAFAYIDADRAAGRWLMSPHAADHAHATTTIAALRAAYEADEGILGFVAGLAHGVRLGRTFAPERHRAKHWISDEYRRLSEHQRRQVARVIRRLLNAEPARSVASPEQELAAAMRWAHPTRRTRAGT